MGERGVILHRKGTPMLELNVNPLELSSEFRTITAGNLCISPAALAEFQRGVLLGALLVAPPWPARCWICFRHLGPTAESRGGLRACVYFTNGRARGYAQGITRANGVRRAFKHLREIHGLDEEDKKRLEYEVIWLPFSDEPLALRGEGEVQ